MTLRCHLRRFPFAAVVAVIVYVPPAIAQRTESSTIPVELAAAFARMYTLNDSNATVAFAPGVVAPEVAARVPTPPNSRIIGTVTLSHSQYVFGTSTMPVDSVLAFFGREFTKRGLSAEALVRLQGGNPFGGGFRPALPKRPTTFCDGRDLLDVAANTVDGMTNFRVRVAQNSVPCTLVPSPAAPRPTPAVSSLPLPILYDPLNASARTECYNTGSTQRTQTVLETDMTPAGILDHYAQQLTKQGWSAMLGDYTAASAVWSRRDSAGVTEVATLTASVSPTAPMCRAAVLDVVTLRGR